MREGGVRGEWGAGGPASCLLALAGGADRARAGDTEEHLALSTDVACLPHYNTL